MHLVSVIWKGKRKKEDWGKHTVEMEEKILLVQSICLLQLASGDTCPLGEQRYRGLPSELCGLNPTKYLRQSGQHPGTQIVTRLSAPFRSVVREIGKREKPEITCRQICLAYFKSS